MSEVTVIGNSIFISGNIEGKEDLSVRGRIEGNISLSNTLFLEESGIIKADIVVKNVVISGILVGNIEAEESVEITNIGQMIGDVVAPKIIIRDGAKFRGNIDMTSYADITEPVKKLEPSSSFKRPALKPASKTLTTRRSFSSMKTETKTPAINDKLNTKESEMIKKAVEETVNDKINNTSVTETVKKKKIVENPKK